MEYSEILISILGQLTYISKFLQIFFYMFILFILIYFGYWFFSRFFY